jgi:hypothetical protein
MGAPGKIPINFPSETGIVPLIGPDIGLGRSSMRTIVILLLAGGLAAAQAASGTQTDPSTGTQLTIPSGPKFRWRSNKPFPPKTPAMAMRCTR